MPGKNNSSHNPDTSMAKEQQVLITRIFDAPRKLVFDAWTDPKHLLRWYAPEGCSIHISQMDFREGGVFHHCIRTPNTHDCWCKGVYHEIVVPERIVYSMSVTDEHGNRVEPVDAGMDPEWPWETVVTVMFEEYNGKTKLILLQTVSESLAKRTGAYPGWISMLDRLEKELMNWPVKSF